jgi:hypothetical protein
MPPDRDAPCSCGSGRKYKKCCGDPARAAAALPTQRWHDLDDRVTKELTEFGGRRFGAAWAQILRDYPVDEQEMQRQPAHLNLFIQWLRHEHKFEGLPVTRHYLEARGRNLPDGTRAWLEAQERAWLSVWAVVDLEPGAWIDLVDLLTGERRRVVEATASRSLHKRLTLLARVLDHAGLSLLCGLHPNPLPPDAAARVLEDLWDAMRGSWASKPVPPARLREGEVPSILIGAWQDEVDGRARRPLPRLTNSDGDEVVLIKDEFALVDGGARDELARRLAAEADIHPPEGPRGAFVIAARGAGAARHEPATVLGRVTMTTRKLRLETDSRERADRLRERLERLADGRLRHERREEHDPREDMAAASRGEGPARGPMPSQGPAADEVVLSFKQTHYADWVDHPLPALDGLSPREATGNPALRARLALLLEEMDELEEHYPASQRFDFSGIRRHLEMPDR